MEDRMFDAYQRFGAGLLLQSGSKSSPNSQDGTNHSEQCLTLMPDSQPVDVSIYNLHTQS